jgi:hypothetical protein
MTLKEMHYYRVCHLGTLIIVVSSRIGSKTISLPVPAPEGTMANSTGGMSIFED